MLPTIDFYGTPVTRLFLGDNPFIGNSYVPDVYGRAEMYDYYTAENVLKALYMAEECGINTYMALADPFLVRMIRQYKKDGGKMNIMFQTYPPMDLQAGIGMMMACEPVAIYHQGSTLEEFYEEGRIDFVRERLELIRATGVKVGLGTHVPEIILRAEREEWGMDFYMSCLYNYRNLRRGKQSSFYTGEEKHLKFYPGDPPLMYEVIKQISKPCVAFKIFAGGQVFYNKTAEEMPGVAEAVYIEVFENIKECDVTCIGVFQKYKNQIKENAEIVEKVLKNRKK